MTETRKDYLPAAPTSTKHRTGAKILKISDLDKVFEYFFGNTATMLDAEKSLHVMRPSICRYVAALEREGRIQCLYKSPDGTTGYKAKYWSSNPQLWREKRVREPSLFDEQPHEPEIIGEVMKRLEHAPLFDPRSGEMNILRLFRERKEGLKYGK